MLEKVRAIGPTTKRDDYETLQEWVYQELRQSIITGRFLPGRNMTLRGVAEALNTSPMPVRDAFGRLVAERALATVGKGRVTIPRMSQDKLEELCGARVALETLAAERALPHIDGRRLRTLRKIDSGIDQALQGGDIETLLIKNHQFHFTLYGATPSQVLLPMIESLWLQLGPFMRTALARIGISYLTDRHVEAMDAIKRRDARALRDAIEADIRDGIGSVREDELRGALE
ncbi:MAG: GntR family transcriptional regulator [Rhodospirillales bacterium]|nr:GntR family transcriptional regulator [Rhodospirillales bacterium]